MNFEMFKEVVHNFGKSDDDVIYFNMPCMVGFFVEVWLESVQDF